MLENSNQKINGVEKVYQKKTFLNISNKKVLENSKQKISVIVEKGNIACRFTQDK